MAENQLDNNADVPIDKLKDELREIKDQFSLLAKKIEAIENKVKPIPQGAEPLTVISHEYKEHAVTRTQAPKRDIEADVGKFWLNRIGIVIFALGVGFLISYTFRYFGPFIKILFGYCISGSLFFAGTYCEKKERFKHYGRVLLGGCWAVAYFTTYAMYHFEASRIITSQLLDLLLLAAVAFGMVTHSLKYKSEELSAVGIFIAYLTLTLSDITSFTFIGCLFLALVILALVFKMQWVKMIFFGITLTYLTHFYWVYRHLYASPIPVGEVSVGKIYFLMNFGFLVSYWAVFTAGIHLIKDVKDNLIYNKLAVANFLNFLLFFFMSYPKMIQAFPEYRCIYIAGFGVVYLCIAYLMRTRQNNNLFVANVLTAISLFTLAIPLRFVSFNTSIIWLIEIPFLLFLGIHFKHKSLRYFSRFLAAFLFLKLCLDDFSSTYYISYFSYRIEDDRIISFLGLISSAVCFYMDKYLSCKEKGRGEDVSPNLFSGLLAIYTTIFLWSAFSIRHLTFALSLEALALFLFGAWLKDRPLRIYAVIILLIAYVRFCCIDTYVGMSEPLKWFTVVSELVIFYTIYFLYKLLKDKAAASELERTLIKVIFTVSTLMLIFTNYHYISSSWISLSLGISGLLLFIAGFLLKDRFFRVGGFVVFGLTIARVILTDLSVLPMIYKIISFIILGLAFLGVSFIYTNYSKPNRPEEGK